MIINVNPKEEFNPYISKWNLIFEVNKSHWMVVTAEEGATVYPCYACRDMFGSRNSFFDHVNRISIAIRYNCPSCKAAYKFYNPCSLLLHIRTHFNSYSGQVNLDDITIEELPLGYMGFPPHANVPLLYDYQEDSTDDRTINSKFYNAMRTQKGQRVIEMVATVLLFYQNTSNHVSKLVLRQISRNTPKCIFVNTNVNIVSNLVATEAPPNTAGVAQKDPFKNIPIYNDTVRDNIVKKNYNKCPECGQHQESTMATHFTHTNLPLDEEFQCSICSYISPTACSFKAHQRIHQAEPPYVCPECGKDFKTCRDLLEHLDDVCFHIAKQVRLRCPKKNCCKIFAQVVTFHQHFGAHLQPLEKCSLCNIYYFTQNDFDEHIKNMHPNLEGPIKQLKYLRCSFCEYTEEDQTKVNNHVKMHSEDKSLRMYVYICKFCRNFFRSAPTYATHLLRCPRRNNIWDDIVKSKRQMPITYCSSCNYLIRMTISLQSCPKCGYARSKYLRTIDENSLQCLLCNDKIIAGNSHHCKYVNARVIVTKADKLVQEYQEKMSIKRGIETISPTIKKKRKKPSVSPQNRGKIVEIEEEDPLELPSSFDGVYTCNICKYKNPDRAEFHQHIVQHRDHSTEFQCMECGTLFVVKPSFQKHLLFYHQVIDVEAYIEDNNCVDKEAIHEMTVVEEEPVRENQCKVCREQFNNEFEFKKHFRIHGMAFLLNNVK